jgi:hypothetical protein
LSAAFALWKSPSRNPRAARFHCSALGIGAGPRDGCSGAELLGPATSPSSPASDAGGASSCGAASSWGLPFNRGEANTFLADAASLGAGALTSAGPELTRGRISVAAYTLLTPATTASADQRAKRGRRHHGVGAARSRKNRKYER